MLDEAALSRLVRIAQRPSPLQVEPVHRRHAVRLALDSETQPNDFEERFPSTLLHWHGPPTPKQQTTLENVVARLVRTPLLIRF